MEPRKIIDNGTHSVSIEDESMPGWLKLRIGQGERSSIALLSNLDTRRLAYALLLEADRLQFDETR
jgi:hypothetical protein